MSSINGIQAVIPVGADGDLATLNVNVTNVSTPVELTGDVMVDTFGALDDAAEADPDAASATIPALLRGSLGHPGQARRPSQRGDAG